MLPGLLSQPSSPRRWWYPPQRTNPCTNSSKLSVPRRLPVRLQVCNRGKVGRTRSKSLAPSQTLEKASAQRPCKAGLGAPRMSQRGVPFAQTQSRNLQEQCNCTNIDQEKQTTMQKEDRSKNKRNRTNK